MPWILNEDGALKSKLSGLTVTDVNAPSGRSVAVRFRLPERELANLTFPCLIIEHQGIVKDSDREMRGFIQIPYTPEGYTPFYGPPSEYAVTSFDPSDSPYYSDAPIPYRIDYQITLMSRKIQHHIPLVAELAGFNYIPARFGYLAIPEDGTIRRLDLSGGPEMSTQIDSDGKRLFTASWLINVSTELFWNQMQTFTAVQEISGRIHDLSTSEILAQYLETYDSPPVETTVP